ncbi:MAG: SMC family ATPase [Pseudanabaenaceae cyanobacterium bins.68]|nr:SMC family ATPase [Pseudanabaenaceae cyanobacterium bins.68]
MVPYRLRLTNFLSYLNLDLDFSGLHVACICGENGAGKSSLLEAITWAIWGKSRVKTEEDVIHLGMKEAQVDFRFAAFGQIYRVRRQRTRRGSSSLEFQVAIAADKFKSLTERTMRGTQQSIINYLKMDYDTFVNSVYLRQGRADEFMLKSPPERKALLAEILNLAEYDLWSEKAKEIARIAKGQAQVQAQQLEQIKQRLQAARETADQLTIAIKHLDNLTQDQAIAQQKLANAQDQGQQRQQLQQQHQWQEQRLESLVADLATLAGQAQHQYGQLTAQAQVLAQRSEIMASYQIYQQWQQQEQVYNDRQQRHGQLMEQHHQLQVQIAAAHNQVIAQLERWRSQVEQLQQQQSVATTVVARAAEIRQGLANLQTSRQQLESLEQLRLRTLPLLQRQQLLQRQVDRVAAQTQARLVELERRRHQLAARSTIDLEPKRQDLEQQILRGQRLQSYQQQVLEKGQERGRFLERLKSKLSNCEEQYQEIQDRRQQLSSQMSLGKPHQLCPLCDRPLDLAHWRLVEEKQKQAAYELQAEIWLTKEQLATSEVEIEVLRQEYRRLQQELKPLPELEIQLRLLQAEIQAQLAAQQEDLALEQEMHQLEQGQGAIAEQQELAQIADQLAQINYDEKNYALIRGEIERWRWAEVKAAELKTAQKQLDQIERQLPDLSQQILDLEQNLANQAIAPDLQAQLRACTQQITQLDYHPEQHQRIRQAKAATTAALLQHQQLAQAEQQYPILHGQYQQLCQLQQQKQAAAAQIEEAIATTQAQIQHIGDPAPLIHQLQHQLTQIRQQMDQTMAQIGKLEQQKLQLEADQQLAIAQEQQLHQTLKRQSIHQELYQAFGKNGIQALIIETILPQIEAETNQILGQLSDYQLHVRFVSQKSQKSKIIETLEIEIADHLGTRAFETYSGGEAFRISFAIRLAISRILAQRNGGKLQTLILDEGFGSQDQEGCDRLVSVINAIAVDFECILVITHMPKLKEAFTHLIEVTKTEQGSQICLTGN